MSREVNDPLAEFDRQLRAELSIAPSPEFEARVRQRIDEHPVLRSRWMPAYGWLAAAATLALATVVGIAIMSRNDTDGADLTPRAGQDVRLPSEPRVSPAPSSPVPLPEAPRSEPSVRIAASRPAPVRREPEVIVPLNQLEAVRRLAVAVNEGRIDAAAPAAGPLQPPAEPVPPAEVVVAPIVVEPLPVPTFEPEAGAPSSDIRRLQ